MGHASVKPDFVAQIQADAREELIAVLEELVRVQDETACVWRTSPIMDRIRAALANSVSPKNPT